MERSIPGHITVLYLFTIINLVALFHVSLVNGEITVVDTSKNTTIATYDDMPAVFGGLIPDDGISGILVYVKPNNACSKVERPPTDVRTMYKWIALIAREGCDFAEKVYHVQQAGYNVAIVHNKKGEDGLVPMSAGAYGIRVKIPSVFVGYSTGMDIADNFNYKKKNIYITIDSGIPIPNYKLYLWPFAIVVGTCFILIVIFMIAKWCRDRARRNRSRLSSKHLKKIPIKKFKKGDYYDVCAICLDDYEEGDKLRILPCSHAYHRKCIDPWLTKNRKTCPICKRRVIPGDDKDSESESDEEGGGASQVEPTERTPLLGSGSGSGSGSSSGALSRPESSLRSSTFDRSGLPESVRAEVTAIRHTIENSDDDDTDSVSSLQGAVGGVSIQVEDRRVAEDQSDTMSRASNSGSSSPKAAAAGRTSARRVTGKTSPRGENTTQRADNSSPSTEGQSNPAFVREEDEVTYSREERKSKQNQVV